MIQYTSRCFYSQCLFYLKNKTKVKLNYDGYTCPESLLQTASKFNRSVHLNILVTCVNEISTNALTLFVKFSKEQDFSIIAENNLEIFFQF